MPLPSPTPLLVINARTNGKTKFLQEGDGFTNATTVTVTDLSGSDATDTYIFDAEKNRLSATRLLVSVTCTPPANARPKTNIEITTTTGTVTLDSGIVPVLLDAGRKRRPVINHSRVELQRLRLEVSRKSSLFFPITGLGDVGQEITDKVKLIRGPERGMWELHKAWQQKRRVKVVLTCTSIDGHYGSSSDIACTFTDDDNGEIESPAVEVTYVPNPDEDP